VLTSPRKPDGHAEHSIGQKGSLPPLVLIDVNGPNLLFVLKTTNDCFLTKADPTRAGDRTLATIFEYH